MVGRMVPQSAAGRHGRPRLARAPLRVVCSARMPTESFDFTGSAGVRLAARLDRPAGQPRATALLAHCFTCSKDLAALGRIARGLASAGIAVLRFDFTGLGESGGDFAHGTFTVQVGDLAAAAAALGERVAPPQLLIGHSLGGAAVLQAAAQIPSARAIVTIGAPASPGHVLRLFTGAHAEIEAAGEAEVSIAGRPFRVTRAFLDDLRQESMQAAIAGLRRALLVMHAPRDEVVGIDNAGAIFAAARHPKSFVSLDDADHLLRRGGDAEYVASMIAAWSSRYLEPAVAEAPMVTPTEPTPALDLRGAALAAHIGREHYTTTLQSHDHRLIADEPRAVGGEDRGPAPYDLVMAGLGACTAMTLRMYADRKGWPLESVTVRIDHDRVHAVDCQACEAHGGIQSRFTRRVAVTGDLPPEARARLIEIAEKCPVHRLLAAPSQIETTLDDEP